MASIDRPICPVCGSRSRRPLFEKDGGTYVRCDDCRLVYANPASDDSDLKNVAEEWAKSHHGSSERLEWETNERIADVLYGERMKIIDRYRSNGRILDVGCSTGAFLAYAKSKGWTPSGCEMASYTAEIADKKLGGGVTRGSFAEARYDDSQFDVVTMWDVLEHVVDPGAFLFEAFRVLRVGGLLVVATPNYDSLTRRLIGKKWEALYPSRHLEVFDKSNLGKLVESRGGKIVRITTMDVNPFEILSGLRGGGGFEKKKADVSHVKGLFAKRPILKHARNGLNAILGATGLGDVLELYAEKVG